MDRLYCSRCLVPLSRRERLFESLLCGACEQKLTAYHGSLPDPNLAFRNKCLSVPYSNRSGSESKGE